MTHEAVILLPRLNNEGGEGTEDSCPHSAVTLPRLNNKGGEGAEDSCPVRGGRWIEGKDSSPGREAASAATLKPAPLSLPGFRLSRGIPRDPSVNRGGCRNTNAGRGAPRDRAVGRGEIGVAVSVAA
ncbi:hypothetical protein NDU88_003225 [Pleurodeles waltl]|uniref:Uncharacterized protein n=1 Tax=Pleurodeles waltl TaxID=8319 RepID=A0AAV7TP26_PLEWA|nr:hypothetical protein NDU88_003225 [Pleurodeles waltl]